MNNRALDRRILWYAGLLVLSSIYYFVPWRSNATLAAVVGIPFLILYTIVLPGIALDRFLARGPRDFLSTITLWTYHGLAALLVCAFVWTLSGAALSVFTNILPVVIVALSAAFPPSRGGARSAGDYSAPGSPGSKRIAGAYAIFVAVVCALVYASGPPVDYGKDTLDYVAYTNEVSETGEAFPNTAFYIDPGPDGADLRKGLLHSIYGYYKWYLGVDSLVLFRVLGAALLALVLLAVYTTAGRFFGPGAVAALSGVLFVISFDGGLRSDLIRSFFYPNRLGIGFLLLFLTAALPFVSRSRPRLLVLCAIYAFAAAAVHIQYAVLIAFVVLTILAWKTCFDTSTLARHVGRSVAVGSAAFMAMLPYAAFRYLTAYRASDLHREVQGSVFITDRLFVADPIVAWQSMGIMGAAALLAIVPLWNRRKSNPALGYCIASCLTLIVIQFNPFFMPVVFGAITYLVFRLGIVWPFYMLVAYFLVNGLRPAPLGTAWGPLRRVALVAAFAALAAGFAPVFGDNALSPNTLRSQRTRSHERWQSGLDKLNQTVPERAVIASDPVTSYSIAAFTGHHVVCTFDQHAPPNDLLSRERSLAARDILSPFTSASDKAHQAARHRVTHVVVNEDLGLHELSDYWTVSETTAPIIVKRFSTLEGLFDEVGGAGSTFRVYQWNGKIPRHVEAVYNPLLRTTIPPGATPVGEAAGLARCDAAEIRVEGAREGSREPVSVSGGQSIEVALYWSRERDLMSDKYIVAVRFDRADVDLPFDGKPFPKIVRKITERFRGERYRFRQDHKIADGFFTPDLWPLDSHVFDTATIRIPRDVAPGRYIVRAKLMTRSTMPNTRLRDLFYDDDVYHGVPVGEIEVLAP